MFYHQFKPIVFSDSKILILGSFPSVKSRNLNFYYMHPQNRFWEVLSNLYLVDFVNASVHTKIELLKNNHIALYDVIEACEITKSSEASIKNVIPTNISELVKETEISHIYLNGDKAFQLFKKYNKDCQIPYNKLPSTSPANAAIHVSELLDSWKVILKH